MALEYHHRQSIARYGEPQSPDGEPQQICVLALGKLGARELNLSSDVDLVFLYGEQGSTRGPRRVSNQEFFLRVARDTVRVLNETTADGFVFRVDMRLRPYGESSPLVQHRDAMENYYVEQGRDWERYAFIKARAVAGNMALGEDFLSWLSPFVYRRHLDYGAVESLREMKLLIDRQVETRELHDDLKLGAGGIREIEFIAQAHQLIWGGTKSELRQPRLLSVLDLMAAEGLLPEQDIDGLKTAYVFLRNSEHAIQGEQDRQTHSLPQMAASQGRLAEVMGFTDYSDYLAALSRHRGSVRECFGRFMTSSAAEQEMLLEGDIFWRTVWMEPTSDQSIALFRQAGFDDAETVSEKLAKFAASSLHQDIQDVSRDRIGKLMPVLLSLASRQNKPGEALSRVLPIIEAIERRSTYVSYLLENMDALKRTVELCAMSPWVAMRLNQHPILLYELSDRKTSEFSFTRMDLEQELDEVLMVLDHLDLESQMDALRVYKNAAVLRVAVCELLNLLPLMKASDALTLIAEVVLSRSLELAWRHLVARHGSPTTTSGEVQERQFVVIAYGKLGGRELAYGSDLDLVFLYDADLHGDTNGDRPINNNAFFVRLTQRIIHILTSLTRFGMLYEVDMHLRPAGNKGTIVSAIGGYERYQRNDAWTWEHQALIRARCVAGDQALGEKFLAVRNSVLAEERDVALLRDEVTRMREKMRAHLGGESTDAGETRLLAGFDLKHETGAIVDIEFVVQYGVLAWAHRHHILLDWTDTMRLLDEIRELGLLSDTDATLLQDAYLAYRAAVHYQWLGGEMSSFDALHQYRQRVHALWQEHMVSE